MMFFFVFILFILLSGYNIAEKILLTPDYFEGDIILTPEERQNIYKDVNGFGASKKKWPGKRIIYDFAPDIEKEIGAKQAIYDAINDYHRLTCLQFVRRTTETTYILFYNGQGCGAPLGYRTGKNRISLQGPACWTKGTIIHEIMHNLGFYHEQSRPDRDNYVKILWDNISSNDMKSNFMKQPYSNVDSLGSPYDYLSIMHYHKDGFAKRGTITIKTLDPAYQDKIGQGDDFSQSDLMQLKKLYQCGNNFATQPPITSIFPVCQDNNPNCAFYSRYCKDSSWLDFMKRECKFTCSYCDSSSSVTPTKTVTKPAKRTTRSPVKVQTTTSPTTDNSDCLDILGKTCLSYFRSGHCNSKSSSLRKYMERNCKSTCSYCKISCGVPSIQTSRVIAGHDAKPGAWPWMTAIYHNGMFNCGGSLVTPTLVVTAAHCVYKDKDPKNYYVYLGDHDRRTKDGNEQLATISNIIIHQDYYKDFTLNNDIALMVLSTPIALNNRAKTICLPHQGNNLPLDSTCFITGWGKIKHPGYSHDTLQQAHLNIIDNKICHNLNSKMPNRTMTVTSQMICAGHGRKDRRSGCHGDSGGPFVCKNHNGAWTLQGVVSWGSFRCDTNDAYTVFARVSTFRTWIQQYM